MPLKFRCQALSIKANIDLLSSDRYWQPQIWERKSKSQESKGVIWAETEGEFLVWRELGSRLTSALRRPFIIRICCRWCEILDVTSISGGEVRFWGDLDNSIKVEARYRRGGAQRVGWLCYKNTWVALKYAAVPKLVERVKQTRAALVGATWLIKLAAGFNIFLAQYGESN